MKQFTYYSQWPIAFLFIGYAFGIIFNHTFNPFQFGYWTSMGIAIYWLVTSTISLIWRGVKAEFHREG